MPKSTTLTLPNTGEDTEQELSSTVSENRKEQELPRYSGRKTKLEDFLDWVSNLRILQKKKKKSMLQK